MTGPLTLVVPTYNEAARLDLAALRQFVTSGSGHRLCFVDDGSRDATVSRLQALVQELPAQVEVLVQPENRGKGEAVRIGLRHALESGAAVAGFIDADLSAPLSEVAALEADLAAHPECWAAFGSRVKLLGRRIVRSEWRHYFGRVFATAASLTVRLPVYDTQCGLKLFRNTAEIRDLFAEPFVSRWIFDVELLARLARVAGADIALRVREVPLERWEERGGSRLKVRDFLRAPLELWRIRRRYPPV